MTRRSSRPSRRPRRDRDDLIRRIRQYAGRKGLVLRKFLGGGIHGSVFAAEYQTQRGQSAIKGFERQDAYERERDVYLRLREHNITAIRGCRIPVLIDYSDELRCIEMEVVSRPFVLDFAGAYLDEPPDFSIVVHPGGTARTVPSRSEGRQWALEPPGPTVTRWNTRRARW